MSEVPEGYEGLSKSDFNQIDEAFEKKSAKFGPCELCGKSDWRMFPGILSPKVLVRNKDAKTLKEWDNRSFNQIAFSCSNCGNTKYIELYFLGVDLTRAAV